MKYTPQNIQALETNQIFVFGSNKAGRHGKGAALMATRKFGAVYGVDYGLQGKSFGIPTKDEKLSTLPLLTVKAYVDSFIDYARKSPELEFLVTEIGCGLAGYTPSDIAPMFKSAPSNVKLPESFYVYLE